MTATPDQMMSVLQGQRRAFAAELPVAAGVRKERLTRVIALMVDHGQALADAIVEDFGERSRDQTLLLDITGPIRSAKATIKEIDAWMRPEKRKLPMPMRLMGVRAGVEYQPKGVIGIIAPWNAPILLAVGPLIEVIAAGNRAMMKMSEITPRTGALVEQLVAQYFDPSEIACFNGGPEVGQAFAGLPFDHLLFTGATGVGKHILRAAAENLVPVTLELGGKSPSLVGRSADLAQVTQRTAMGKLVNAGQVCLAPDYMLVPRETENAVIDGIKTAVAGMFPTMLANPDYCSAVNARHANRLQGYIDDARAKGAEVITINPAGEDFAASNGNKMPLHIVRNPTDEMAVMREEIFGPILPIRTYERVEEAIDYVNAHDRPLALYYYGYDKDEERRVLDRTISGGVTVNDAVMHTAIESLPFGGIGQSGMGSYHGYDGFKTFSHAKAVLHQTKLDAAKLLGLQPPYGEKIRKAIARDLVK